MPNRQNGARQVERTEEVAGDLLALGLHDFRNPRGLDFVRRAQPFERWVDDSSAEGYFQFLRHHTGAPDTESEVEGWGGQRYRGVNLASQDYLGLARNRSVTERSANAVRRYGSHSAGSEPMGGGFREAKRLEAEVAEFTAHPHAVLFPTGWSAGYGGIKGIVRPYDYVVMDHLSHDCLQHGARSATPNVSMFAHNDLDSLRTRLVRVRRRAPDAAVLVVTESLFSMDSDHPDFVRFVALCREFDAFSLVDVAHDLGVLGPEGRGVLAESGCLEEVDFLVGSFSKVFGSIGGFFASRAKGPAYQVRGYSGSYTFSNYLIPAQVAAVRRSLEIVQSSEGDRLRCRVLERAERMSRELAERGVEVIGRLSPIVMVKVGREATARRAYRRCLEAGVILNNIEFPACRKGEARFRLQMSPSHSDEQIEIAAAVIAASLQGSQAVDAGRRSAKEKLRSAG